MIVVVSHEKRYAWAPLPAGIELSEDDKRNKSVTLENGQNVILMPSRDATKWEMRVTVPVPGDTTFAIGEADIIEHMFRDTLRSLKLTRQQTIKHMIDERLDSLHHGPQDGVTDIKVHDSDGPDEKLCRAILAPHLGEKYLPDQEALEEHVAAYMHPATAADHESAMHKHFRTHLKKKAQP